MSAGVVYLLHFDRPFQHARHYTGWTTDLERRLVEHQSGLGGRLIAYAQNAGVHFDLARTWSGDRRLERRIKTLGSARRFCPVCSPGNRWARFMRRAR